MSSRLRRESSPQVSFFSFLDIITAVTGILILVTLILATDIGGYAPVESGSTTARDEVLNNILRVQAQIEAENSQMRRLVASAATAPTMTELSTEVEALRHDLSVGKTEVAAVAANRRAREVEQTQSFSALGLDDLQGQLDAQRAASARAEGTNERLHAILASSEVQIIKTSAQLTKIQSLHGQSWLRSDNQLTGKRPMVVLVSAQGAEFKPLDKLEASQSWTANSAEDGFRRFCKEMATDKHYFVFIIRPSGIELFRELVAIARSQGFDVGYDAVGEDLIIHIGSPPMDSPADPFDAPTSAQPSTPPENNRWPTTIPILADSPAATSPVRPQTTSTTPLQRTPSQPKPKSWWERLVQFVKDTFGITNS
jgi:hypothetical protein